MVFDKQVFWSEFLNADLESLAQFLDEPMVDLDSLGDFELNGMVEIIGLCLVWDQELLAAFW